MGQLVDIGTTAGKAAPGEYSPSALLTARGDTIVRDSTGVPVRHALGAAGTFLGSDGTDLLDRKPPGYLLDRDDAGAATPLNTTGETTILTAVTGITSVATTGIFTKTAHGLISGQRVNPSAGVLDSFLTAGTVYFVSATNLAANTFSLSATTGGAVLTGTTNDTNLTLVTTMTNALPAFVALGDDLHLRCWGHSVFGATGTLTLNVYAGATKIATSGASTNYSAGAARGFLIDLWIHLLSSTTVGVDGLFVPKGATGAGFGGVGDTYVGGNDQGDAITVSALPLAIDIKAVCSTATSTTQVSCKGARVFYYPRNT